VLYLQIFTGSLVGHYIPDRYFLILCYSQFLFSQYHQCYPLVTTQKRKNLYLYLARRTFTNLFLREYLPTRDGRGTRK
jgi:hypothetical protein